MAASKADAASRYAQLPLGIRLKDEATFDNYYPGANGELETLIYNELDEERERFIYLWGAHGSGKTHLLQAICHWVAAQGLPLAYVPLSEAENLTPQVLDGLEQLPFVVGDDLDAIAGNSEWETALFHLHNRIREQRGCLVMAGLHSPVGLDIALADLRSRVAGGLVLQIQPLNDEGKADALRLRARRRGMEMSEEVAVYLLRRSPRDMTALFGLLETLDQASLAAQRKLTIPFVKEVLESQRRI